MSDETGERKFDFESKLVCDAWNAALEAAARCVEQANRDGPYNAITSHRAIRELKK